MGSDTIEFAIIANVRDGTRTQHFTYDGLNRLVRGQGLYGTHDYRYDGIGNRLIRVPGIGAGADMFLELALWERD